MIAERVERSRGWEVAAFYAMLSVYELEVRGEFLSIAGAIEIKTLRF